MTLPQPSPELPELPPREKLPPSRSDRNWIAQGIIAALVILSVMAIAGLSNPKIQRSPRTADRTEALNNIKQIGLALMEFESEFARFPDASTIAAVQAATNTPLTLNSTTSNDLFRQCLASDSVKSEKPFWAKTPISPKKSDNLFNTDASALAKGECGFAYIAGLSSNSDPGTPVVMTSLVPGKLRFDPEAFQGKAIVLFVDVSAKALPVEPDGRVIINGMDIFDPRQPFWKGKSPDVKWPE